MNVKELKEHLSQWGDDEEIYLVSCSGMGWLLEPRDVCYGTRDEMKQDFIDYEEVPCLQIYIG